MAATDCWNEVPEDGVLERGAAEAIFGYDLWLCVITRGSCEAVLRGFYLGDSFHLETGDLNGRTVTHYWVRDFKPEPPSRCDAFTGLW